jgi:hypothetical protein
MSRKYDTLDISPALRVAVDALCEHKPFITDLRSTNDGVEIGCYKCSALGTQRVLPKPGPVVWHDEVPSVTLYRVKGTSSTDEESPLGGVIGDSAGVFYQSNRYRNQEAGALRGLTYEKIEEATETEHRRPRPA